MLLAELNGIKVEAADVGNACLEACTKEKLCVVAGPKFGDQQGNVMVIVKALHGLRTSGARFHEKFADALLANMQFLPCKADPDVWMKDCGTRLWHTTVAHDCGTHYEHACVYVNDLVTMMKDSSAFFAEL
jgi:hypothetical protein